MEIKKAIKIEIPIVLKSTFVLKLLNDINNKATQIIKIPTKPKKGIISFRKMKDKIVTKIGAQPLATGQINVRSFRSYMLPNRIKYRLCNKNEQVI